MIRLDERLSAIVSCVEPGAHVADIGCDHGKVIVWLLERGIAARGIAADISEPSLAKARLLAQKYNVQDKIDFVRADGFPVGSPADTVIIAGLGAAEIIKILTGTPEGARLILCPHRHPFELRRYLIDNNFYISKDYIIKSKDKYYSIIVAKKGEKPYNGKWIYLGANLPRSKYFAEYLLMRKDYISKLMRLSQRLDGVLAEEAEEISRLTQIRVRDITDILEKTAPLSLQMEKDNAGLAVGDYSARVSKVMVALDASLPAIRQAAERGCDMLVTHHPLIFEGIKQFDLSDYYCSCIAEAIKSNISIYCSHTNFDGAKGGLNEHAARLCALENVRELDMRDGYTARIGETNKPLTLKEYARKIGVAFNDDGVRTVGNPEKEIKKAVVVNGGGGGSVKYIDIAIAAGADCFISGDIKYHVARYVKDIEFSLIGVGHYHTELPFTGLVKDLLEQAFPSLEVMEAKSECPYNPIGGCNEN
jgi:dinuclear metal center YbgI/SA1388 family protein